MGLCILKKKSSNSSKLNTSESKVIFTASACPVSPALTSSYVGDSVVPPVYPTSVCRTPGIFRKISSMPQKQPPAKVATSVRVEEEVFEEEVFEEEVFEEEVFEEEVFEDKELVEEPRFEE